MSVRKIAQLLGVSHAAVSLALRNSPKISEGTKRRVRELADRLGYRPNAEVRTLMSRLSLSKGPESRACIGVISLYDSPRPWEQSLHLKRMFEGMAARADFLGYRLEPLWLEAPGMSRRRFRTILETRGIEGLLCFGAQEFGARFPRELDGCAIVTQGLSISTPLHRVINDAYRDTWRALDRTHRLGYRRPGLILGRYEEERSGYANASAYLGWCEYRLGRAGAIPLLHLEGIEAGRIGGWLRRHKPDVVIFVDQYRRVEEFGAALEGLGFRVPDRLAVVVESQVVRASGFSGMEENPRLMGERAVELLVGRIVNRDFGIPAQPRVEMVESRWVDGGSLPRRGRPY